MNRYDPQLLYDLKKSTTQLKNIKPLKLTLIQFYAFMMQRCLNRPKPEIPRGNSKVIALFDMLLETESSNPLSVHIYPNVIFLPDDNVTWSVDKYESN